MKLLHKIWQPSASGTDEHEVRKMESSWTVRERCTGRIMVRVKPCTLHHILLGLRGEGYKGLQNSKRVGERTKLLQTFCK
jgi:hypothetical protein